MLEKPRFPENTVVSCDIKLLPTSPILNMFKWIKRLFKMDNNHCAGLPYAKKQSESLPCASMQSEIIANELEEKEQSFSEPVNLIVESLKEEGRWTWEFPPANNLGIVHYYALKDTKTNLTFKVYFLYRDWVDCSWATEAEKNYMGKAMLDMVIEAGKKKKQKQASFEREKITSLYKEASNAE